MPERIVGPDAGPNAGAPGGSSEPRRPSEAPRPLPRTSFAKADTRHDPRTLYERVGGAEGVARIVDEFYDRVEADEELRPLFPEDTSSGREKQRLFLSQWLGGPAAYSERWGHPRLRIRHFPFVITRRGAGRWLRHMGEALHAAGVAREDVTLIMERLGPLAKHMINDADDVPRDPIGDVYLD